jgi:hypothetical protein
VIHILREEPLKKKRGIYKVGLYPVTNTLPSNIGGISKEFFIHSGAMNTDPDGRSPLRGAEALPSLKASPVKTTGFASAITAVDQSKELKRREDLELKSKYKKVMNFSISSMAQARKGSMPTTGKYGTKKSYK